ncbi:MAG: acyltransferase [Proteobacteria bacterium]|nr:acyltransferase [Pseudomonadota bacterium]
MAMHPKDTLISCIKKQAHSRDNIVDLLKGLAMLGVLWLHIPTKGGNYIIAKIGSLGRFGVPLFFLISAILLFYSYDKIQDKSRVSRFQWLLRRVIRLIPLYYLALIIYVSNGGCVYWSGDVQKITFGNIVAHILFMHGLFPCFANSVIGVEWYLGVYAIFIILTPIVRDNVDTLPRSLSVCLITYILAFLFSYIGYRFISFNNQYQYVIQNYFGVFCFVAWLPVLMIANFVVNLKNSRKFQNFIKSTPRTWRIVIYTVVYTSPLTFIMANLIIHIPSSVFNNIIVIFFGAVWLFATRPLRGGGGSAVRICMAFGKFSYPIYLFHPLVLTTICPLLVIFTNELLNSLVTFFLLATISLFLGRLLIYVENVITKVVPFVWTIAIRKH